MVVVGRHTPPDTLDAVMGAVRAAPRLAVCVVGAVGEARPAMAGVEGVVVAWSENEAAWVRLGRDDRGAVKDRWAAGSSAYSHAPLCLTACVPRGGAAAPILHLLTNTFSH